MIDQVFIDSAEKEITSYISYYNKEIGDGMGKLIAKEICSLINWYN